MAGTASRSTPVDTIATGNCTNGSVISIQPALARMRQPARAPVPVRRRSDASAGGAVRHTHDRVVL
jgi:hypothetical protein